MAHSMHMDGLYYLPNIYHLRYHCHIFTHRKVPCRTNIRCSILVEMPGIEPRGCNAGSRWHTNVPSHSAVAYLQSYWETQATPSVVVRRHKKLFKYWKETGQIRYQELTSSTIRNSQIRGGSIAAHSSIKWHRIVTISAIFKFQKSIAKLSWTVIN